MIETTVLQRYAVDSMDSTGIDRRGAKLIAAYEKRSILSQNTTFPEHYSPHLPLSQIMHRLELASAEIHNVRIISRNAHNINVDGKLEAPEKTIEGHGDALALAIKGQDMEVYIPSNPARIRDRPKNFNATRSIEDYTSQDILDLIVFYNDDFGILREDEVKVWREKLCRFLTRQRIPTSSLGGR